MLQRWLDQLRRRSGAGTAPLDPKAAAKAARRLAGIDRPLTIAIAAFDPEVRHAAHDVLEGLGGNVTTLRLEDAEGLGAELQLRELDLVVLDLALAADVPGGDSPWARIARARPRVTVVAIAGPHTPDAARREAAERRDVAAVLDAQHPSFPAQLARAAVEALEAREARRAAAAAAFEAGLERALSHPATGARSLVEAYRTGELAGPALDQLRERFNRLATSLPEAAPERADVLAVLAADAFDRHDEVGLIYHATMLAEAAPARAAEAEAWLARRDELVTELYAAIDRRLEHVMVLRRIGRFRQVKRECDAVHDTLANILPAHHLEAEALRNEGELAAAIAVYDRIADLSLQNGEVDRARQALAMIDNLDPTGEAAPRVAAVREAIGRIEDQLADPSVLPRYPCLRVCNRVMCQEAAEASRGFFVVDPGGECDVCDLGILGRVDGLQGRTIAVVGGRLGRFYADALKDLGAARVLLHDAIAEPAAVPALVAEADAVVLVTGAASHWGILKAERELARKPRPSVRVHFYGVRQVARAVALDLVPRLMARDGTGRLG